MAGMFTTRDAQLFRNNHRKNKRERTQGTMENNDYLLTQIDEFREKAKQLQALLLSKETKVKELQTIVAEREDKAEELQQILEERQEKADGITAEVNKQINRMIEQVSQKMDEVQTAMSEELEAGRRLNDSQADQVKEILEKAGERTNERVEELVKSLSSVNDQLEGLKPEIADKIHTENVKCYRNIQDLFKGFEDQIEKIETVDQNVRFLKKIMKILTGLAAADLIGVLLVLLHAVGIF